VLPTNTLSVVDTNSGQILPFGRHPSPRGVEVHDGQVYLLSGQHLLRLDTDGNILGNGDQQRT